jgi:hypothetical protein
MAILIAGAAGGIHSRMLPVRILETLSLHARVATAVAPFAAAVLLRILFGKSRLAELMLTLATVWFAANVLAAPFSDRMQEDVSGLGRSLR